MTLKKGDKTWLARVGCDGVVLVCSEVLQASDKQVTTKARNNAKVIHKPVRALHAAWHATGWKPDIWLTPGAALEAFILRSEAQVAQLREHIEGRLREWREACAMLLVVNAAKSTPENP